MPAVLPPQPRTAHTAGARSPFLSGPAPLIASKMHKKEKKKSHWGCAAAGLASVQLRRSISCLPSLMQTSLCPRQSVHPQPSLPRSLPSTRALSEPDIWHGWTQCAAGQGSAVQPLPQHERCPPVPSPPAPLPSSWGQLPWHPELTTDTFQRTAAHSPAAERSRATNTLCCLALRPITAPLSTSPLQGCLTRSFTGTGMAVVQPKPLLAPPLLAATQILLQGGDTARPALPGHCLSPCQTNGFGGFGQG